MKRFWIKILTTIVSVHVALAIPAQAAIIIDHTCTDLSLVPSSYITAAKDTLRIGYSHTSHGSQLVTGIETFRGDPGTQYYYTYSGWGLDAGIFLNDYWGNAAGAGDLGHYGDLAWRDATVQMLSLPDNDRNVVIWSWCGGVSDNDEAGINAYLNAMNLLEQAYPAITFVYMTGHLDGTGSSGNLHIRNNQIRNYCLANDKILFDFADIESYDPSGLINYMELLALDSCYYDGNNNGNPWDDSTNWALDWVTAFPGHPLSQLAATCGECAHSEALNCVLKGRAFWWLMARLAGWEGVAVTPTPITSTPTTGSVGVVILIAVLTSLLALSRRVLNAGRSVS